MLHLLVVYVNRRTANDLLGNDNVGVDITMNDVAVLVSASGTSNAHQTVILRLLKDHLAVVRCLLVLLE